MPTFKSVENNSGLMAVGDYEVYVKDCCESVTKGGNDCIKFDFVVRSDVEQPYQGKHIFKNFYPNRDTGAYPEAKIGRYANALRIEKGQDFELYDLIGRSCIVHISHFTGDDGETRECIYYSAKSKIEPYMAVIAPAPEFDELDVLDGELPF